MFSLLWGNLPPPHRGFYLPLDLHRRVIDGPVSFFNLIHYVTMIILGTVHILYDSIHMFSKLQCTSMQNMAIKLRISIQDILIKGLNDITHVGKSLHMILPFIGLFSLTNVLLLACPGTFCFLTILQSEETTKVTAILGTSLWHLYRLSLPFPHSTR